MRRRRTRRRRAAPGRDCRHRRSGRRARRTGRPRRRVAARRRFDGRSAQLARAAHRRDQFRRWRSELRRERPAHGRDPGEPCRCSDRERAALPRGAKNLGAPRFALRQRADRSRLLGPRAALCPRQRRARADQQPARRRPRRPPAPRGDPTARACDRADRAPRARYPPRRGRARDDRRDARRSRRVTSLARELLPRARARRRAAGSRRDRRGDHRAPTCRAASRAAVRDHADPRRRRFGRDRGATRARDGVRRSRLGYRGLLARDRRAPARRVVAARLAARRIHGNDRAGVDDSSHAAGASGEVGARGVARAAQPRPVRACVDCVRGGARFRRRLPDLRRGPGRRGGRGLLEHTARRGRLAPPVAGCARRATGPVSEQKANRGRARGALHARAPCAGRGGDGGRDAAKARAGGRGGAEASDARGSAPGPPRANRRGAGGGHSSDPARRERRQPHGSGRGRSRRRARARHLGPARRRARRASRREPIVAPRTRSLAGRPRQPRAPRAGSQLARRDSTHRRRTRDRRRPRRLPGVCAVRRLRRAAPRTDCRPHRPCDQPGISLRGGTRGPGAAAIPERGKHRARLVARSGRDPAPGSRASRHGVRRRGDRRPCRRRGDLARRDRSGRSDHLRADPRRPACPSAVAGRHRRIGQGDPDRRAGDPPRPRRRSLAARGRDAWPPRHRPDGRVAEAPLARLHAADRAGSHARGARSDPHDDTV